MSTNELFHRPFQVLGDGFVELQDLMPHPLTGVTPDQAIAAAARVSYLKESKGPEKDAKLIEYLMEHEHTSPFEQVEFKFRVRAPLVVFWQWVRHRTFAYQSINSQSGRYTDFEIEDAMYFPGDWRLQDTTDKQASNGILGWEAGAELSRDLKALWEQSYKLYEKALEWNVAREQARLFLPGFGLYYTWVVKVDLWNLFHFLNLRMAPNAQYEIRMYAKAIYQTFVKPLAPVASKAFEFYLVDYSLTD